MNRLLLYLGVLMFTLASCANGGLKVKPRYTYLALGDSYTIGESVESDERFPRQLTEALNDEGYFVAEPTLVARTGWTTANLNEALQTASLNPPYDLVTLLIGVNNQYQGRSVEEYRSQFSALLDEAIAYTGGNKNRVLVLSIPDYGYTPFGQARQEEISAEIDQFNAVKRELTLARGVHYLDITPISRQGLANPSLVASDGLHPSARQYAEWVEALLPVAISVLKE